jgi:hypothetical protein
MCDLAQKMLLQVVKELLVYEVYLDMLILWADFIDEFIIQHSFRAPECNVCHSAEYIQVHLCLKF